MTVRGFNGWRVFWTATALLLVMAAAMVVAHDFSSDGVRLVIRATARTSLALFLLAFVASSALKLWPSVLTRWLRSNRRQLGLSFAMSHFIHLMAIIALARNDAPLFWTLSNPASIAAGSLGYLAIALLAATSFDRMVAALGPALWQRLHTGGVWFIWLSFMFTNGKRIPKSAWYMFPVFLLLVALATRLAARRKRYGTSTVSTASPARSGQSRV